MSIKHTIYTEFRMRRIRTMTDVKEPVWIVTWVVGQGIRTVATEKSGPVGVTHIEQYHQSRRRNEGCQFGFDAGTKSLQMK